MNSTSLNLWLNALTAIYHPKAVLFVGAGTGNSPLARWLLELKPSYVCMLEGDEEKFRLLDSDPFIPLHWNREFCVVVPEESPGIFHYFNNPYENGLVSEQTLKLLWPAIATAENGESTRQQDCITISNTITVSKHEFNWLLIDCLPSVLLLPGRQSTLNNIDVIVLRIVSNESLFIHGSHRSEADSMLEANGFRCVRLEPERHPDLALAIYLRSNDTTIQAKNAFIARQEEELFAERKYAESLRDQLSKADQQLAFIQEVIASVPTK